MISKKIGIFVGSLRKASYSKKIAELIVQQFSDDFSYEIISIGDLPLYNQDFDDGDYVPESYKAFREKVASLDGFLFITPEYNRSVPAVLKNALDVGSRPAGKGVWSGKPGAVISNSPGTYGAFGANHHLRQSLMFLNIFILQQPEAYYAHIGDSIDENGNIVNDKFKEVLVKFIKAFENWALKVS